MTGIDDGIGDRRRQLEVVAVARPVGVDRGQQDLAGAELLGLAGPVDRRPARRLRAGVRVDLARGGVDRDDDRLRAETLG